MDSYFLQVENSDGYVSIEFITEAICHVTLKDDKKKVVTGLDRYGFINKFSEKVDVKVIETNNYFTAATNDLEVKISKVSGFEIKCLKSGKLSKQYMQPGNFRKKSGLLSLTLDPDEEIFGFGDLNRDYIKRRGTVQDCVVKNVSGYVPVPFFISDMNYGIFFNTTYRITFDIGKKVPDLISVYDRQGCIDFYYISGSSMKEIIAGYTLLTGRPELPPVWSFGLWYLCRTQADDFQVMSDVLNFRREGIPCDVIGLEPGWMEKNYDSSVNKDWNSKNFFVAKYARYGPHSLAAAIKRMGYHLELWLCNEYDLSYEEERRLGNNDFQRNEADELSEEFDKDAFLDENLAAKRRMDTVTKPEEPWFSHLKDFVDQGVDFFKQDGAYQVMAHPNRLYGNNMTDDEMHNLNPLLYVKQMYTGFAEHTGRRPLVFTVCGWIGFQKYCGTWTGDTGGKAKTLGAILNLSLCGHSFSTNDMEVTEKEGIHLGFMIPWAQLNNWNYWRQPWFLGDTLFPIYKYYANLRARLIPLYYTLAYESHTTGVPLIRPMFLEFTRNKAFYNLNRQFMIGRDMLVSAYTGKVVLPKGQWLDYWSNDIIHGEDVEIDLNCPVDKGGGLFLREGAIIPSCDIMQYRGQRPVEEITFEIFPTYYESEFTLYEDDGTSFDFKNCMYATTRVSCIKDDNEIKVTIYKRIGSYKGIVEKRFYSIIIYGINDTNVEEVTLNGVKLDDWKQKSNFIIIRGVGCGVQENHFIIR